MTFSFIYISPSLYRWLLRCLIARGLRIYDSSPFPCTSKKKQIHPHPHITRHLEKKNYISKSKEKRRGSGLNRALIIPAPIHTYSLSFPPGWSSTLCDALLFSFSFFSLSVHFRFFIGRFTWLQSDLSAASLWFRSTPLTFSLSIFFSCFHSVFVCVSFAFLLPFRSLLRGVIFIFLFSPLVSFVSVFCSLYRYLAQLLCTIRRTRRRRRSTAEKQKLEETNTTSEKNKQNNNNKGKKEAKATVQQ